VGGQGNRTENIVDLGGGAGIDFFIYRKLFGDVNWTCLETEALCQVLANKEPIEENLNFSTVSNFLAQYSEGFDFALYSNSALQYIPEPLSALKSLLLFRPSRVAIVRTPFVTEGEEIRTTQRSVLDKNGPQVGSSKLSHEEILTPLTILNIEIVRELFEQNGYWQICENVQSGSFTKKQSLIKSSKSRVRTFDFLALRIDQESSIRES
jgi:putative methyltransferase (TIGR04325 family)